MSAGDYNQPLVRKAFVECPAISGYVAARLRDENYSPAAISGTPATATVFTVDNLSRETVGFMVRETPEPSISGTRYDLLGSAISLVPGGVAQFTVNNKLPYLEIYCTQGKEGYLRIQAESLRRWRALAMDRTDPYYPASLWQAKAVPGPLV
jgi:hypothetical protein